MGRTALPWVPIGDRSDSNAPPTRRLGLHFRGPAPANRSRQAEGPATALRVAERGSAAPPRHTRETRIHRGGIRGTPPLSAGLNEAMDDSIRIRGARQHNLKNIDLDLP